MKFTKKTVYVGLFAILYLIVAFSSFFHACAFFNLANNSWMSVILAFAFEVGQAAVLFSLLTSVKDRSRIMPWVLMIMFTLVQVIGNIYSSYKYIITNSVENLRYFKEPIFIWTDLPDAQANVIIVYLVGALLPIASLLLTSMITNYLTDQSEVEQDEPVLATQITSEKGPENPPIEIKNSEDFLNVYGDEQDDQHESEELSNQQAINNKDEEIDILNKELINEEKRIDTEKDKSYNNDDGKRDVETNESKTTNKYETSEDSTSTNVKKDEESNSGNNEQGVEQTELKEENQETLNEIPIKRQSHFINL